MLTFMYLSEAEQEALDWLTERYGHELERRAWKEARLHLPPGICLERVAHAAESASEEDLVAALTLVAVVRLQVDQDEQEILAAASRALRWRQVAELRGFASRQAAHAYYLRLIAGEGQRTPSAGAIRREVIERHRSEAAEELPPSDG